MIVEGGDKIVFLGRGIERFHALFFDEFDVSGDSLQWADHIKAPMSEADGFRQIFTCVWQISGVAGSSRDVRGKISDVDM